MHLVQIWITHINALKTRLMHKNVQPNLEKSQKFTQHSCCSMLTQEKNFKVIRGNGYRFVPKVARSLPKTIMLVVRSSGLWEAYTQTCPKCDKFFTTACWCRSKIFCTTSHRVDDNKLCAIYLIFHLDLNYIMGSRRQWTVFELLDLLSGVNMQLYVCHKSHGKNYFENQSP